MWDAFSDPTLTYILVLLAAVSVGKVIFDSVDGLTYQIVTVFVTLIIVSNCAAKLYARVVLDQNV